MMKKIAIIILIQLFSINIYCDDIVNIWADNLSSNMGVSKDRVWLKSYFLSNFEYYSTIKTETKEGVLTVVTASRELYFLLDELFRFEKEISGGGITITLDNGIYHFVDDTHQLDFSFSLEKPGHEIFTIIDDVYECDEVNRNAVRDHYLESWVIRIYSGENVIEPDVNTLDFDDVLITATIIGEKFQWLWGVHDGVDYITKSIKKITRE